MPCNKRIEISPLPRQPFFFPRGNFQKCIVYELHTLSSQPYPIKLETTKEFCFKTHHIALHMSCRYDRESMYLEFLYLGFQLTPLIACHRTSNDRSRNPAGPAKSFHRRNEDVRYILSQSNIMVTSISSGSFKSYKYTD